MNITLDRFALAPTKAHASDAGYDLYMPCDMRGVIAKGHPLVVRTGVHFQIPSGWVGMVKSKSGLYRKGIRTEGVVDAGYTGSVEVTLYNDSDETYEVHPGDKITQIVFIPCLNESLNVVETL